MAAANQKSCRQAVADDPHGFFHFGNAFSQNMRKIQINDVIRDNLCEMIAETGPGFLPDQIAGSSGLTAPRSI
jgi:hypothetical protein